MKKELDKAVTCTACDNFTFCIAKESADEFVKRAMSTGLFRGDKNLSALDIYSMLANNCRKFDKME